MNPLIRIFGLSALICLLPLLDSLAQPINPKPRDSAYPENIEEEREIIPYHFIREADVFWRKRIWREIDVREKMNLAFAYPGRTFSGLLLDAIREQQLFVYEAGLSDDFSKPLNVSELEKMLYRADTVPSISPFTGRDTILIVINEVNPEDVKVIRLKEDWIFDEGRSTMTVRILGICPVIDRRDQTTGEILGKLPLFWVYYPDARQLLANHYAFNPYNDAVQLSWEEILENRMFSSYVVKESNVYDRRIQDYAAGIDAVLEAERLKYELFKKEHELWTY